MKNNDLIGREDVLDALIEKGQKSKRYEWGDRWELNLFEIKEAVESVPSAEPELKTGRKFLGIVVNYPKICTYPEYEGKPYYSIKYEENGDMIVGFGTYKPEVLSQYLREYFISPAEPERIIKIGQRSGKTLESAIDYLHSVGWLQEHDRILTESAEPELKWIPVTERLPMNGVDVIVSVLDDSGDTPYRFTSVGWCTPDGQYWVVDNEMCYGVIAWMPLPEPWKGER